MTPGLVILIAVAVFSVLLLLLKWYLDRVWEQAGRGIERRHRTAFRILETGKIPAAWVERYRKKGRLGTEEGRRRAKRKALSMLDSSLRYFDRAAPFENLEAKRAFMSAMRRIRTRWADTPESGIVEQIESADDSKPWGPFGPAQ